MGGILMRNLRLLNNKKNVGKHFFINRKRSGLYLNNQIYQILYRNPRKSDTNTKVFFIRKQIFSVHRQEKKLAVMILTKDAKNTQFFPKMAL